MKHKNRIITTVIVFVLLTILAGFSFSVEAADQDVIAKVNDTEITLGEFQEAVRYKRFDILQEYQYMAYIYSLYNIPLDESVTTQYETALSASNSKELGQQVIDQLAYNRILDAESEKAGVVVADEEVTKTIKSMFGFSEEDAAADETAEDSLDLSDTGSTDIVPPEPEVNKEVEFQKAFDSYFTETAQGVFTKEFFQKQIYYSLLESKFLDEAVFVNEVFEDEMVSARHILVETEETAQEILDKLEAGEDWNALAAEFSQDTSNKDNGGELGWFARGTMVLPFEEAAFALNPGEISAPVKTDFGYHIIASDGKEVRPLEDEALNNAKYAVYKAWYEKVTDEYPVESFDNWEDKVPTEPVFEPIVTESAEDTAVITDGDSETSAETEAEPTAEE